MYTTLKAYCIDHTLQVSSIPPTPSRRMCQRGMLRNCWSVRGISFRWIEAVFALVLLISGEVPFTGQYIRQLLCAQSHRSAQHQTIIH